MIRINGKEAARTNNMHRPYRIDLKSFLEEGENTMEILFMNLWNTSEENGREGPSSPPPMTESFPLRDST